MRNRFALDVPQGVNIDNLISSYNSLVSIWNRELYPLLSSLSKGTNDSRWYLDSQIDALSDLSGATLFVDNSAEEGSALYFDEEKRPYTLKEIIKGVSSASLNVVNDILIGYYSDTELLGDIDTLSLDAGFIVEVFNSVAYVSCGLGVRDGSLLLALPGQVDIVNAGIDMLLTSSQAETMTLSRVVEPTGLGGQAGGSVEGCVTQDDFVSQRTGPEDEGKIPILGDLGTLDESFFNLTLVPGLSQVAKLPRTNSLGFFDFQMFGLTPEDPGGEFDPNAVVSNPLGFIDVSRIPLFDTDILGEWRDLRVAALRGIPIAADTPADGDVILYRDGAWTPGGLPGPAAMMGHQPDANTVVLWEFDDTIGLTSCQDTSGNGRHGTRNASYTWSSIGPFPGTKGLELSGRRTSAYGSVIYEGDNTPFQLTGDMTFEAWLYLYRGASTSDGTECGLVSCVSDQPGSTASADNMLYCVFLDADNIHENGDYWIYYFHEHSSGTTQPNTAGWDGTGTGATGRVMIQPQKWTHFAFTRSTAGTQTVNFYVDGVESTFASGLTAASGGTNARIRLGGHFAPATINTGGPKVMPGFPGIVANVHISNIARSASYIRADVLRGFGVS